MLNGHNGLKKKKSAIYFTYLLNMWFFPCNQFHENIRENGMKEK